MDQDRHRHKPASIIRHWLEAYNRADAQALAALYHEDANCQLAGGTAKGRDNIHSAFADEFAKHQPDWLKVNLLQDQGWAMLEWKSPGGERGCTLFKVKNGLIKKQRSYLEP